MIKHNDNKGHFLQKYDAKNNTYKNYTIIIHLFPNVNSIINLSTVISIYYVNEAMILVMTQSFILRHLNHPYSYNSFRALLCSIF